MPGGDRLSFSSKFLQDRYMSCVLGWNVYRGNYNDVVVGSGPWTGGGGQRSQQIGGGKGRVRRTEISGGFFRLKYFVGEVP